MGKKRTALIQVECMYEVPIPEDLNLTDEEAGKWALQEFIRNSTVNVVKSSVGDKPSFREEHIETKDGRAHDFDSVVVHSVTEDGEIERILEAICNGGKVEKTPVEANERLFWCYSHIPSKHCWNRKEPKRLKRIEAILNRHNLCVRHNGACTPLHHRDDCTYI